MFKNQNKISGFTLIELMIVIGVVALLSVTTIPLIKEAIPNYRLKGTAKDIFSNLQRAKLEAIRQNTDVIMTFTPAAYTAAGGVGSYTAFVDNGEGGGTAGNGTRDGSEIILVSATMPATVSLSMSSFTGSTGFNGQGFPYRSRWGRVQIRNTDRWYEINLSSAGYIKLEISRDGINFSL